jgi:hypothetical protein
MDHGRADVSRVSDGSFGSCLSILGAANGGIGAQRRFEFVALAVGCAPVPVLPALAPEREVRP